MTETAKRVLDFVNKHGLLEAGDTVAAGVSGGADSVCLLLVLRELSEMIPFTLQAVHIHHGIRREAGEDETFVKALCGRLSVPCRVFHEDVPGYAGEHGLSEEEAGRVLRYRDFEAALRECGAQRGKTAVAHHADDCAETLLFHLFRGTGLTGMGGIRPRRGNVIRPLLELDRKQIEAYLREREQSWRTDATNDSDAYTRNKIRHHILPYAEAEICRGAGAHLAREAALLAQTADYMRREAEAALHRCLVSEPGEAVGCTVLSPGPDLGIPKLRLSVMAFRQEEELLQSLLLQECIRRLGRAKDMTSRDVEALTRLFRPDCQSGRRVSVSGLLAAREFETVLLRPAPEGDNRPAPEEDPMPDAAGSLLPSEGVLWVPGLGKIVSRLFPAAAEPDFLEKIPRNQCTKWFDYDKIIQSARFRKRRPGDYLTIDGQQHHKKLQDYLIEEKMPAKERDSAVLLADGAHIMWVPGHRISAAYKVTEQTKRILEVYVRGGT